MYRGFLKNVTIYFPENINYHPDFDSKKGQKKAPTPANKGTKAFTNYHKYVA